ncbi:hypothetical protein D3C86_1213500 [compost metagenome]
MAPEPTFEQKAVPMATLIEPTELDRAAGISIRSMSTKPGWVSGAGRRGAPWAISFQSRTTGQACKSSCPTAPARVPQAIASGEEVQKTSPMTARLETMGDRLELANLPRTLLTPHRAPTRPPIMMSGAMMRSWTTARSCASAERLGPVTVMTHGARAKTKAANSPVNRAVPSRMVSSTPGIWSRSPRVSRRVTAPMVARWKGPLRPPSMMRKSAGRM